jgi:23S rRNA pseudouridine1911/1915/1917 synthase
MPRHALHARSLGFVHPTTRQEMHFESELPEDFKRVIERWENYSAANTQRINESLENEL